MTDAEEPTIWMRPEVSGHGKAPAHSRDQIAAAAVAIADAEGIEAVSMRRVAREVDAGTMSLYRYLRNKDELYALMVDAILGPDENPRRMRSDWQDMLRDVGRSIRQLVLQHPWFPALQAGMPAPSPKMFRGMEGMLAAVDGIGLTIDEMLEIVFTVMTFAMGSAQDELAEARAIFRSGLDRQQWQRRQGPYLRSLIESGEYPYLRRMVVDAALPHEDPDTLFERALNRIITGIAATAKPAQD
ncbi:MAG: TetR/AcrR family transcriptional regulator [Streptosporangiales bacterium]